MFDEYIARYGRGLYGLCRTLCGNAADADDLYQQSWLRALERFHRYDESRDFKPWLTAVCVNCYRDSLRKRKRRAAYDGDPAELEQLAAPTGEDYSDLYAAVDRLPEKLRLAVILFYFHDLDLSQTARGLGISVGAAKSRLYQARKKLKEVLLDAEALPF